ncbi:MAG: hypothetical protein U9O20_02390 [Patescibacteria group bacterium]|nr:hypothetical protein [Patescibacteria group bacterium]
MKKQIELELAWLVKNMPKDLEDCPSFEIVQGYLPCDDDQIKDERVRKKKGIFTHTKKRFAVSSQETGFCEEETKKISEGEYLRLMEKGDKKVRKKRYLYPLESDLIAEIDVYKDNLDGLVVVEVEFSDIEGLKKFDPPEWFGKEVTDSLGVYPPHIANLTFEEVNQINQNYEQKPHDFERKR